MSSIDPGATGIPPVTPNVYSQTNSLAPRTLPLSFDATSISSQQLVSIPPSSNNPVLPIAEYFQSVSESALRQKIQEFLDAFNDATKMSAMWQDSADQAVALRDFINKIYKIVDLQNTIVNQGQLENAKNQTNAVIDDYNAGVTGPGGDQEQVQTLNNAINSYNSANNTYQTALQNYNATLSTHQAALNEYNTAVATWDNALQAYLNGTISQSELEAARSEFNNAKASFANSESNLSNAKAFLDAAESNVTSARQQLEVAKDNYNAYVASREDDVAAVNAAIDSWNTIAQNRNERIAELNQLRSELDPPLPPIPLIPLIPPEEGLDYYEIPPESSPAIVQEINININSYNNQAAALNDFIANVLNPHITSVNNTGYTPPISEESAVTGIPFINAFPTVTGEIPFLETPTPVPRADFVPFVPVDVVTIYLLPRMLVLDILKDSRTRADNFQEHMENLNREVPDYAGRQNTLGGSGASVAMSTISPRTVLSSPFLDSILSKQSFEAFFNFYGAPLASPLVDQIGALSAYLLTVIGLSSAGPANTIIGQGTFGNIGGESTVSVAVALGFLKQISNVTSSDFLEQNILGIVQQEASLNRLTDAQKQELAALLSASVTGSMLEIGLNEVARSLSIPGLTPQVVASVAGMTTQDALATLGGQLYAKTLLAQAMEEQFTLSREEAYDVSQKILQEIFVGENTSPQELQSQLVNAMLDQIGKQQADDLARVRAREIADAIVLQIIEERQEQADRQKDAFRQAIIRGLQKVQNLDEREASKIASRILGAGDTLGSISQSALSMLPKVGLTDVEASSIVQAAESAYNSKDAILNPLSAPSLQKIVSSADLAVLFKTEISGALSPVIGNRKALEVAEDYGNLIFSSSHSVLNRLEQIDRLERKSINSLENRAYDKYLEVTKAYRDPSEILSKFTSPGRALINAAVIGAPSAQGVSPLDNTLGIGLNQRIISG